MAPAPPALRRISLALCACILLAASPSFAIKPPAAAAPATDTATPATDTATPATDTAAPAAQPDGTPQLNDDGTPKLDAAGNPITTAPEPPPPPPCVPSKGHKCPKIKKKKKEKPPKVTPANISRGTFTVDGVIGKAALNYAIPDLKFIYFYAPGIGAVVVSDNRFAGAVEQKNAFHGQTLTVTVGGNHTMQLFSDDILLSKRGTVGKESKQNKKAESAFVVFNPTFTLPTRFPQVGYGDKPDPPYAWPGSKMNGITKGIDADAPAVPTILTPKLAKNPCPTGQVLINAPPPAPVVDPKNTVATTAPTAAPRHVPPPKCVLPKDVPPAPPPTEKYIPLDQRPRS
jgi:hypothetical protein